MGRGMGFRPLHISAPINRPKTDGYTICRVVVHRTSVAQYLGMVLASLRRAAWISSRNVCFAAYLPCGEANVTAFCLGFCLCQKLVRASPTHHQDAVLQSDPVIHENRGNIPLFSRRIGTYFRFSRRKKGVN